MKKQIFFRKRPIFFLTLCLAFLFWLFFLTQVITAQFAAPAQKAIPAFLNTDNACPADLKSLSKKAEILNENTARISLSDVSDGQDNNRLKEHLLLLLQQYDGQIRLISAHKEKNYADYYFYSPKISQNNPTASTKGFNLHAAITHNYVYFGIPLIQYDF